MDGVDAEADLSQDRANFLQRHDIMALVPRYIKRFITHPGDNGQIRGFEELFVYLETTSAASELRRLVEAYFAKSPALRLHLSMSPTAKYSKYYIRKLQLRCASSGSFHNATPSQNEYSSSAASLLRETMAASSSGASFSMSLQTQEASANPNTSVPGLSFVTAQTSLLNLGTDTGQCLRNACTRNILTLPAAATSSHTFTSWDQSVSRFRPPVQVNVDVI